MYPNETSITTQIAHTYGTQLSAMEALHDTVSGMLMSGQWTIQHSKRIKRFTAETMIGLLIKSCRTFRSVHVLCERGFHDDASACVRVLMETTTAIIFILRSNPNERAITFQAHGLFQQLKMIREWKKTPGLKRKVSNTVLLSVERAMLEMEQHVPKGVRFRKHWSGTDNLKEALATLRGDAAYATLYRYTSSISHGSDFGGQFHTNQKTGDFEWKVEPEVGGFAAPSYAARVLLWQAAHRIDQVLGLGYAAALSHHKLSKQDVEAGLA